MSENVLRVTCEDLTTGETEIAENQAPANRRPKYLADPVWCLTCEHMHIPAIPAITFMCASDCGFGAWSDEIAEHHATVLPDHIVYPVHHRTVLVDIDRLAQEDRHVV